MEEATRNREISPIVKAIKEAYQRNQEDETLEPIVAVDSSGQLIGRLGRGDYVIFYDIRGEREAQLTESLISKSFNHFLVKRRNSLNFVTMIEYDSRLKVKVAFPPEGKIKNTLGEVVSRAGFRLLKIAESEKAVHVGFFMNGKREVSFPREERIIVSSPEGLSSYALKPEMSASQVTREVSSSLKNPSYRIIVANLANVDVVGHEEDKIAVLRAVETVDSELGKIIEDCRAHGVTLIVTSDHGTVEEWLYPDGMINTGHTKNPVPFILGDFYLEDPEWLSLREEGELADVAPTVLDLLGLEKPSEMTGESLILDFTKQGNIKRRILLLVLDGWGLREERKGNLILEARTPNFDRLWKNYPHSRLKASGDAVGMPAHTVGNSEAGHLHLGAGRRVFLDRVKIDRAIEEGSFFRNEAFEWAMKGAREKNKPLHFLGIVSHYSSHGTIEHLFALLQLAEKMDVNRVFVHALMGRRGEKPESGAIYVNKIENMCHTLSLGQVVTVMGRFWALDREKNWNRIKKAYNALVFGEGNHVVIE